MAEFILNFFTENPWVGLILVGVIVGMILRR